MAGKTWVAVGAIAAIAVGAFAASGGDDIERVGYFKDDAPNRVMIFSAPPETSRVVAQDRLARSMHTDGRVTIAVIYTDDSHPGHRVTNAPSFSEASAMLDRPPFDGWTWGARILPDGTVEVLR